MRCLLVIPARMASTRFPGKPLCDLLGKPMIQWVAEAAVAADVADWILVATPDQEIVDACVSFGVKAVLTRLDHPSGTDRIVEVAERYPADLYVNVQGDEPLIEPESIRALAEPMLANEFFEVGTLFCACPESEIENPAVVKLVKSEAGKALYFSRYPIPFARNPRQAIYKHIGLYAYRRPALEAFAKRGPTQLEVTEGLEQLRFLELGFNIQVFEGSPSGLAVDTPEQAEEVRRILKAGQ
jgi:3-deoxy-D-manno-octulosonate cytidylyltransferase